MATAGLTYFRNDFRDLIDYDFSRGYVNIGRARTRGVEAAGEFKPGERIRLRLAYTRLEALDLDIGIAPHAAAERPSLGRGGLVSRRPMGHPSHRRPYGREGRPGLFGLRRLERHPAGLHPGQRRDFVSDRGAAGRPFVRFDNILNARYEPVFGYGAPGFCLYAGFRLN